MYEINTVAGNTANPGWRWPCRSACRQAEALISSTGRCASRGAARGNIRRRATVDLADPLIRRHRLDQEYRSYLDRVWDHATQAPHGERRSIGLPEIIAEVFIAGSDLSQQVSQATRRSPCTSNKV